MNTGDELDMSLVEDGMYVEIDPAYGGGRGVVINYDGGSFVALLKDDGSTSSHHGSDLTFLDYEKVDESMDQLPMYEDFNIETNQ